MCFILKWHENDQFQHRMHRVLPQAPSPDRLRYSALSFAQAREYESPSLVRGKNRLRRGHTVEPTEYELAPGYQFVAEQGLESMSSCYSDQYGFSKSLLPNRF